MSAKIVFTLLMFINGSPFVVDDFSSREACMRFLDGVKSRTTRMADEGRPTSGICQEAEKSK